MDVLSQMSQPEAVIFAGVVGGLASLLTSIVTNFFGRTFSGRVESRLKYAELRRDSYSELVAAADEIINQASHEESEQLDERQQRLVKACAKARMVVASIRTEKAIRELAMAVAYLYGLEGKTKETLEVNAHHRLEDFMQEVRRELGMKKLSYFSFDEYNKLYQAEGFDPSPRRSSRFGR